MEDSKYTKTKKRIFSIIQIGNKSDIPSKSFDIGIVLVIFLSLFITLFETFDGWEKYKTLLDSLEIFTIVIFTVEYALRLWTSCYLYPNDKKIVAIFKFIFSFYGIIDLLSFFPFYLPFVFPRGAVAFRLFRVIRIFRLFKINAQYDAYNVIINVLKEKKNQLFSSLCMILILMTAASLTMYGIEHDAQPEQFSNALSGIWWAASSLLTVGYGDIYPITTMGKIVGMFITFLGVGMVAIPTGIISAGFVEQYTKINKIAFYAEERKIHFVTSKITQGHSYDNKKVSELVLPPKVLLVLIIRDEEEIIPKSQTIVHTGDILVLAANQSEIDEDVNLIEVIIKEKHPWVNTEIKYIDISRKDTIVLIERGKKSIIPTSSTTIRCDDRLLIYSKNRNANQYSYE